MFFFMYWIHPVLYVVGKVIAANGDKHGASAGALMKSALKDARHFFRNWRMQGGELVAANRGGLQLIGRDRDRGASSKILAGLFARWHVWLEACKELWEELKKPRPRMDQLIKILSQYSFPGLGSGWAETGGGFGWAWGGHRPHLPQLHLAVSAAAAACCRCCCRDSGHTPASGCSGAL